MSMITAMSGFAKKFKLDSHHAIERFGVFVGLFALSGALILGGSAAAAFQANRDKLSSTAVYSTTFETSKTQLQGTVDGLYRNETGTRVMLMMHFDSSAAISYNAADYRAFILGSTEDGSSEPVKTGGITASLYMFGSTGYLGFVMEAPQPFARQVLNITMRANAELTVSEQSSSTTDALATDETFAKYDQWRMFINPGASGTIYTPTLDNDDFTVAQVYYDAVLKDQEHDVRDKLDQKLLEMRANLTQISSYTADLATTRVDNLRLLPPTPPASIKNDKVTGKAATETSDGVATLTLATDTVVRGGFNIDWRSKTIVDGYLDSLTKPGQSYVDYLNQKASEESDDSTSSDISKMTWVLSDGSDLTSDYQGSDVTMKPLVTVMNNLSQAYQSYATNKRQYQSDLLRDLIDLEVQYRNTKTNSSVYEGPSFARILY